MKAKILVVGSSLKDMGGIVTVIRNIEQSNLNEQYDLTRVETYITGSVIARLHIFIVGLFKYLYQLLWHRPDVVHIHMSNGGSFYRKSIMVMVGKMVRVPIILHIHAASFDEFYNHNKFQKRYCQFILNSVDTVVVLSQEWKKYFSTIVPSRKIEILYNGVFTMEEPISRSNSTPICLFLGRLGERKGTYDLLLAIRNLREKGVACKFLLAGDGEITEVKQRIHNYGIQDTVDVLGWINVQEKEELLRSVDMLVLPSYNEGLPMAILEAMNFSLPVISTYVGGIPEVIQHGENGYLIEPGDIEGLTRSLEMLLKDKNTIITMGEKNRALIHNHFDMNRLMNELSHLYQRLILK
ncbi:glycosyltransferase family 4 protein [Paenibacillus oryzisoli]|uniref:Glycosyl transferase n=1 Tax=Paenibacillus oryzisoli TaxID=1850517 RepID=A0A198A6T7_9BACL|nr:glycosyltransferase family 4 protein [Paenibacillus oryzisoli]OAS17179.1 glycosyl transferase [Paenibacillus oryzisoli]